MQSSTDCIVHHLGLALGGRSAATFAKRLMLPVSNDTLLRVVRRRTRLPSDPLRVVRIDDWPGGGIIDTRASFAIWKDAASQRFYRIASRRQPRLGLPIIQQLRSSPVMWRWIWRSGGQGPATCRADRRSLHLMEDAPSEINPDLLTAPADHSSPISLAQP
jgi:hypothetical protein